MVVYLEALSLKICSLQLVQSVQLLRAYANLNKAFQILETTIISYGAAWKSTAAECGRGPDRIAKKCNLLCANEIRLIQRYSNKS